MAQIFWNAATFRHVTSEYPSEFVSEVTILIYLLVFCALALCGECVMDGIEPV